MSEEQIRTDSADGLVVMSQFVAGQLICIRDLLVSKEYEEAYHVLYSIADPDFTSLTPWQKLEDIAKGVGCPQASDERVRELENKYNELIMAVACKFPDETRHETALRYIKNAEAPAVAVLGQSMKGGTE